ncbi:E3 ubiquitin-protein ligase RSL1-like [Miscanthus floridulus]|uniref:E3 ubiquitin-protein ligase RSL1-like n=1 Tax=Miscanthus floridulus TaxID=154761 RepID=UPI003459307D
MAATSSFGDDADLMVVDDLYLIAVCQGINQADATGLMAISDEEYAAELQLQEVIVSSAMAVIVNSGMAATAAQSSLMPQLDSAVVVHTANNDTAAAETPVLAVAESSSSSSSSPPPPLAVAAPATGEDDATAVATCKICLDYVPPSHVHHASRGCAHAFCTACLSGYISAKTQGGRISDVKCPGDGEDCCNVLDPELCQGIISGEAFEAWCAALCMSMVEGAGNFCYCPFNDCSEILVDDRGGDVPGSECPACRRLFCARCRVPWHAGISCAEYGQLAPGDKGKEDLVVLEMAKGEKWKRCPQCKFLVDKRDGCVHITCRCGFHFCYACGEPWGQSHQCNAA